MYAYVRTDKMSGTTLAKDLASAKFYESDSEAAIENGNIVTLGALIEGEREVKKATAPAADTALRDLYLVASPEVVKTKNYYGLGDFRNEAGDIIRCYRLTSADQFSVTKEALDASADIAVGDIVEAQAGTKMSVVKSATGSTKIGTVIALEDEYIVIEVA